MTTQQKVLAADAESASRVHRTMFKVSNVLGLTTGIGVIAWGAWSLIATIATFIYEESGASLEEILISNGVNQGLLLSAVVIALGVILLELKSIRDLMAPKTDQDSEQE